MNEIHQPFYIRHTRRNNKRHFKRESISLCGGGQSGSLVAEGFSDGAIRTWDARESPSGIVSTIPGPAMHRCNSMFLHCNYLLASFFGSDASLILFDLRFPSRFVRKEGILNASHHELKITVSQNRKTVAFPNQCGTIRLFDFATLTPIARGSNTLNRCDFPKEFQKNFRKIFFETF